MYCKFHLTNVTVIPQICPLLKGAGLCLEAYTIATNAGCHRVWENSAHYNGAWICGSTPYRFQLQDLKHVVRHYWRKVMSGYQLSSLVWTIGVGRTQQVKRRVLWRYKKIPPPPRWWQKGCGGSPGDISSSTFWSIDLWAETGKVLSEICLYGSVGAICWGRRCWPATPPSFTMLSMHCHPNGASLNCLDPIIPCPYHNLAWKYQCSKRGCVTQWSIPLGRLGWANKNILFKHWHSVTMFLLCESVVGDRGWWGFCQDWNWYTPWWHNNLGLDWC